MEKSNRTLEALLSTPLTDTELLLGKALAALVPALALTAAGYTVYATGAALIVNAHAPGTSLPWGNFLFSALVTAPILAALSTCVSVAISTKAKDVRSAQQLSTFVLLPPLIVVIVLALALGPDFKAQAAFALVFAALTFLVLRITVARFQRDQILIAES
jgi:ABC-2 type transport system permease protein